MDDLIEEFIAETRETLETLSGEIVAWEANPADAQRLDAIFRFVHTVKGSCGFVNLPRLARLSHAAEDALAQVRQGEREPDRRLVNAVLAIVDRIGEIVDALDAGTALDDSAEDLLIAALEQGSEAVAQAQPVAQRAPSRSVRLNVDLLDRMMSGMSEMVLARNELARRLRERDIDPAIEAALERLSGTVADMRDSVTRTRMQRIDALFSPLPRMVRDTAAGLGKSVSLQVDGQDVELDREMIEVMRDPLVHIIRNAIDHGIEAPAERRRAGKSENGRLIVCARQSGNQIVVEISDDGRGIDADRLVQKLVENGREEAELRKLSDRAKLNLIFEPGLSSRDEVSEISGRGVGMDVVRHAIEQIGGRIELESTPGRGMRIALHVPLTLSIISALVVRAGPHQFAVPRQAVEEIVKEQGAGVRVDRVGDAWIATVRDRRLPLISLSRLLGIGERSGRGLLAIISVGEGTYALAIDGVLDTEELVIKPAAPVIMAAGVYAGQALPDSGLPMLLLDCAGLATRANLDFEREDGLAEADAEEAEAAAVEAALLFDDLDGNRRAVPLCLVDRVETVDASAIRRSAGRLRLSSEGQILPLQACGEVPFEGRIGVLRLKDGETEIAYAMREAFDIVDLPAEIVPATMPGVVRGVALIAGEQVELIDAHWLFAQSDAEAPGKPLCLLAEDKGGWMSVFVRPLLEQAGYRVVTGKAGSEAPAVVLISEEGAEPAQAGAPVVRLRATRWAMGGEQQPDSIYRYDRDGLLAALADRIAGAHR